MLPLAVQAAMVAIDKYCPDARNLLLIPENHTRNTYYLENVARLLAILRQTGLHVRVGSINPEISEPTELALAEGRSLLVEPVIRNGRRVGVEGFDPCSILLNNDLSAGTPSVLTDLHEQVLLPPLHAGWSIRRKTRHFAAYNDVARRFSKMLDIDPWLINPFFGACAGVDFQAGIGHEALAEMVDTLLRQIRAKYREYAIDETPFVIVKADAGTYGMGVMSVKDAAEVRSFNRKQRNKMAVVKEGLEVRDVIVQEGVYTRESVEGGIAEPVVYMIDRYVVGGFYRVHASRGRDENLNAPGMHFVPLPFAASCNLPEPRADGVVARLALLAASVELELTDPDQSRYG